MKRSIVGLIALAFLSSPVFAALSSGEKAPMFSTQASLNGKEFTYSLSDAVEKGPVVVYFYPSAYTMGCNIQAHEFAVNMDAFNAAGATVVGVSLDNIERLNDFSADPEFCAGKLPVASDEDGSIAQSYELKVSEGRDGFKDSRGEEIGHGFAERTTFIVGSDGKISSTIGGVSPKDNVMQALDAVQKMAK